MIRYSLKCAAGHNYESWFQSAAAFDALSDAGQVACPVCGSVESSKSLMAPAVAATRNAESLSTPSTPQEAALTALREQVEANSHYVGKDFVTEARKMHEGTTPTRSIHGEARLDEAKKLVEDGVPVFPLPFLPPRKIN